MTTADPAREPTSTSSSPWTWLLPGLTFLVGCLLGGAVIAAGAFGGDGTDVAAPSVSASPGDDASPEPSPDGVAVRVPQACLDAADQAATVSSQAQDAVAAVRDLDARRLQEIVDSFQQLEPEVQRLADECRERAGDRVAEGSLTTPAPALTTPTLPTPEPDATTPAPAPTASPSA